MKTLRLLVALGVVLGLLLVLAATGTAQGYPPGMVSYWKLDDSSGTTAHDSVDANHGTIYGATWTTGKVHGALSFDGNDYVDAGSDPSLDMVDEVTVMAWIKRGSVTNPHNDVILDKGRGGGWSYDNYNLWICRSTYWPAHKAVFGGQLAGGGYFILASTTPITDLDKWYFLVGTFRNGVAKIYVDGELEDSHDYGENLHPTPSPLRIGYDYWQDRPTFNGIIDEVAVYNRALTAPEIRQHYQNGLNGLGYEVPAGVGGIVEMTTGGDSPAAASGPSSARDYTLPIGAAVAAAVIALTAGAWYARRRWQD